MKEEVQRPLKSKEDSPTSLRQVDHSRLDDTDPRTRKTPLRHLLKAERREEEEEPLLVVPPPWVVDKLGNRTGRLGAVGPKRRGCDS